MTINVKRTNPYSILPRYATAGAAGMDLSACLMEETLVLEPGQRALVPTGIAIAVPPAHMGLIFARSGLASKQGIALANGVGVVDCDYRGEVKVALINLGQERVVINHGERIAQLVITPFLQAHPIEVEELDDTDRGAGGFGSTGQ